MNAYLGAKILVPLTSLVQLLDAKYHKFVGYNFHKSLNFVCESKILSWRKFEASGN